MGLCGSLPLFLPASACLFATPRLTTHVPASPRPHTPKRASLRFRGPVPLLDTALQESPNFQLWTSIWYSPFVIFSQTKTWKCWRSGESARLPPMCPGFDSRTRRHRWAEFVGSLLCYSGFPLSSKTNIWFDLLIYYYYGSLKLLNAKS